MSKLQVFFLLIALLIGFAGITWLFYKMTVAIFKRLNKNRE
jgi:hypothetical protein